MIEVVCPTCESTIHVARNVMLGDKIECPECGEVLRVVSVDPFEVDYLDTESAEDEDRDEYMESTEEMLDSESVFKSESLAEDEENQSFELPDKSSLFDNPDEMDENELDNDY